MLRAAAVVALGLALTACTSAPDRADEAAAIEHEIATLPGVSDSRVHYTNDITQGSQFVVTVDMPTASDQEIADAAQRISELRGDDFVEYDQEVTIRVTPNASLEYGAVIDAQQVEQDSASIRSLEPEIVGASLDRTEPIPVIEVYFTTVPWDDLGVLQDAFGGERVDIDVWNTKEPALHPPRVEAEFPLTAEQYARLREEAAALPATPVQVTIRDGAISEMILELADPTTAYAELTAMFSTLGAGPEQPLELIYRAPGISGFVEVGSCDYEPHGPDYESAELTPDAVLLQRQLREEFSTC